MSRTNHQPLTNSLGRVICLILFSFFYAQLQAQVAVGFVIQEKPDNEWNVKYETGEYAWASDVVVDKSGNSYATGFFQQNIVLGNDTFNPGTTCYSRCPDTYMLMKHDARGKLLWIRYGIGSARPYKLALDSKGFIYTVGSVFGEELHFTSSGTMKVKLDRPINSSGIFICKYDGGGTLIKSKFLLSDLAETPGDFVLDAKNNIYIGGSYDFRTSDTRPSVRKRYVLQKLDANWELQWKHFGDTIGQSSIAALCLDKSNNLYVTGYYNYYMDIGDKVLNRQNQAPNQNKPNIFLARFDEKGQCAWAIDSVGIVGLLGTGKSLACDKKGNVYVAANTELSYSFLSKFSKNGELIWWKSIESHHAIAITSIRANGKDIYVSGEGNYGLFEATEFGEKSFHSKGGLDYFLVRYNKDGQCLWLTSGGGTGDDHCKSIALYKKNLLAFGWLDRSFWLAKFKTR